MQRLIFFSQILQVEQNKSRNLKYCAPPSKHCGPLAHLVTLLEGWPHGYCIALPEVRRRCASSCASEV
ncbi:hypothetical protein Y032_0006g2833 [Ancylostoma ceylanicum]|uniref:Uncharacterized protein n=1 Tax=Ancylostoma ceylanicum TaxID=53326 RepID=A0A016VPE6_9BILA|nr:hypothetical protein Y032_0006g2833 [Ancylostoma ceylanicum]